MNKKGAHIFPDRILIAMIFFALEKTTMNRFYRKNRDPVLRLKPDRD